MAPVYIPIVVSIICSSLVCDIPVIQDLLRSNLGPLLNDNDDVSCSNTYTKPIECIVYAPRTTSCATCKQLKDTFTSDEVSKMLSTTIHRIKVGCELPERYEKCNVR